MKTKKIGLLIAISFIMISAGYTTFWMTDAGNYINLHANGVDMTPNYHIFKMYDSRINSFKSKEPVDSLRIDIDTNGNYILDPTKIEFGLWWLQAQADPKTYFNIEGYIKFISDLKSKKTSALL